VLKKTELGQHLMACSSYCCLFFFRDLEQSETLRSYTNCSNHLSRSLPKSSKTDQIEHTYQFYRRSVAARSTTWGLDAWILGPCVRIPFMVWMFVLVCVVLYCEGRGFPSGLSPVKGVIPNVGLISLELIIIWNRPQVPIMINFTAFYPTFL
jgi:hypothetical protein